MAKYHDGIDGRIELVRGMLHDIRRRESIALQDIVYLRRLLAQYGTIEAAIAARQADAIASAREALPYAIELHILTSHGAEDIDWRSVRHVAQSRVRQIFGE